MKTSTLFLILLGRHTETDDDETDTARGAASKGPPTRSARGPKPAPKPAPVNINVDAVLESCDCWVMKNSKGHVVSLERVELTEDEKPKYSELPCHQTIVASNKYKLVTAEHLTIGTWKLYADRRDLGGFCNTKMDMIVCDKQQLDAFSKMSPENWKKMFRSEGIWRLEEMDGKDIYDVHGKCTLTPSQILADGDDVPTLEDIYPDHSAGVKVSAYDCEIKYDEQGNQVMSVQPEIGDSDDTEPTGIATRTDCEWLLETGQAWIIQIDLLTKVETTRVFTSTKCCICFEECEEVSVLVPCYHSLCTKCVSDVDTCPMRCGPFSSTITAKMPTTKTQAKVGDECQEPGNDGQEPESNEAQTISPPQPAQESKDKLQPQRTSAVVDLSTSDDQSMEEEDWPGLKEAIAASLVMCGEKRPRSPTPV